jgi:hypothetical protein
MDFASAIKRLNRRRDPLFFEVDETCSRFFSTLSKIAYGVDANLDASATASCVDAIFLLRTNTANDLMFTHEILRLVDQYVLDNREAALRFDSSTTMDEVHFPETNLRSFVDLDLYHPTDNFKDPAIIRRHALLLQGLLEKAQASAARMTSASTKTDTKSMEDDMFRFYTPHLRKIIDEFVELHCDASTENTMDLVLKEFGFGAVLIAMVLLRNPNQAIEWWPALQPVVDMCTSKTMGDRVDRTYLVRGGAHMEDGLRIDDRTYFVHNGVVFDKNASDELIARHLYLDHALHTGSTALVFVHASDHTFALRLLRAIVRDLEIDQSSTRVFKGFMNIQETEELDGLLEQDELTMYDVQIRHDRNVSEQKTTGGRLQVVRLPVPEEISEPVALTAENLRIPADTPLMSSVLSYSNAEELLQRIWGVRASVQVSPEGECSFEANGARFVVDRNGVTLHRKDKDPHTLPPPKSELALTALFLDAPFEELAKGLEDTILEQGLPPPTVEWHPAILEEYAARMLDRSDVSLADLLSVYRLEKVNRDELVSYFRARHINTVLESLREGTVGTTPWEKTVFVAREKAHRVNTVLSVEQPGEAVRMLDPYRIHFLR